MSWSDRAFSGRARAAAVFVVAPFVAVLVLAACTVQPLYGPTATGQAVSTHLAAIAIDPVDTRVAQQVRNALIFNLAGGTEPATPLYRMKLIVSSAESALGATPIETAPSYSLTVSATYAVTSVANSQIIVRDTIRASATYDRSNQEYANTRAELDAENRAAALVADQIRIRLAVATAKGTL